MISLKKLSFLLVCILLVSSLTACNKNKFTANGFKNVDFSKEQKIHLVTKDFVYNVIVSYNEYGAFSLSFSDDAPEVLESLSVELINDSCKIKTRKSEQSLSVRLLTPEFFPLVLYKFFSVTDFSLVQWTFTEDKTACFFEQDILSKKVLFTVQKSVEETSQSYTVEIK